MKPLPIADYLQHIGRAPGEGASPPRGTSPFRPRSLPNPQSAEPRALTAIDRVVKDNDGSKPQGEPRALRTPWNIKPVPLDPSARELLAARETAKAEDIALSLAQAHARGRAEGLAEARAEAEERRAADIAAAQERTLMERLEFELNEYAKLEETIRSGLTQVEANIGAAVTRILSPFLANQVVKRATDELCRNVARLCAGGSPGLITIRGPERLLALLRQRLADLPAKVDYVEDNNVEAIVEVDAARIATELRPWAELLASLDA